MSPETLPAFIETRRLPREPWRHYAVAYQSLNSVRYMQMGCRNIQPGDRDGYSQHNGNANASVPGTIDPTYL